MLIQVCLVENRYIRVEMDVSEIPLMSRITQYWNVIM